MKTPSAPNAVLLELRDVGAGQKHEVEDGHGNGVRDALPSAIEVSAVPHAGHCRRQLHTNMAGRRIAG